MKKTITLLLLFICIAFSCERDDICSEDTATTPRMVVEFRDVTLTDNQKNVADLRVEDFYDSSRVLIDEPAEAEMLLPLKTDAIETKYRIYKDYNIDDNGTPSDTTDDFQTGNDDIITITYDVSEEYVSRACGYKAIFNNIIITIEPDSNNWMLFANSESANQSVINEDEIHYTIRH